MGSRGPVLTSTHFADGELRPSQMLAPCQGHGGGRAERASCGEGRFSFTSNFLRGQHVPVPRNGDGGSGRRMTCPTRQGGGAWATVLLADSRVPAVSGSPCPPGRWLAWTDVLRGRTAGFPLVGCHPVATRLTAAASSHRHCRARRLGTPSTKDWALLRALGLLGVTSIFSITLQISCCLPTDSLVK